MPPTNTGYIAPGIWQGSYLVIGKNIFRKFSYLAPGSLQRSNFIVPKCFISQVGDVPPRFRKSG